VKKIRGVREKRLRFQKPGLKNRRQHFDCALGEGVGIRLAGLVQQVHCHGAAIILVAAVGPN
jgi:hypothetical protein